MSFYVYTLIDPRDAAVFYVGKGKGARVEAHEREARNGKRSRKCDRIREIWAAGQEVDRAIVDRFDLEDEAFEREISLIASIGLANLTNVLPGGQGRTPPNALSPEDIKARYKEHRLRPKLEALAKRFTTAVFPLEEDGFDMGRAFVSALRSAVDGTPPAPWKPKTIKPFKVLGVTLPGPNALEMLLQFATDPTFRLGSRMDAIYSLKNYCRPHVSAV